MALNKTIKIINYNTWGVPFYPGKIKKRYIKLAERLEVLNPDVITLQEIFTHYHLNILKKSLPSYPYVACKPSVFGPEGGLVTFSKTPFEYYKIKNFNSFSHKLLMPSLWPLLLHASACLITYLKDSQLIIINIHVSPNLQGDWSKHDATYMVQKKELISLTKLLKNIEQDSTNIIICGGLNVPKGEELYNEFFNKPQFTDIFYTDKNPTYVQLCLPPKKTAQCVDYILLHQCKNLQVIENEYIFKEALVDWDEPNKCLSDHYGLSASLMFDYGDT